LPTPAPLEDRDGPRDECGVFGIVAPGREVARLAYFALYALQHRGQESAGIATSQGGHIMAMRDQGLVNQVFDEQKLRALQGDMALGHVRYSTTGANSWENSQPVYRADRREVALGHNGNLVNVVELHRELREKGVTFRSTSDSEIIAALVSTHEAETVEDALVDVIGRVEGAYSTVVMTEDRVVAFRDPLGLRPLSLGMIGESDYRGFAMTWEDARRRGALPLGLAERARVVKPVKSGDFLTYDNCVPDDSMVILRLRPVSSQAYELRRTLGRRCSCVAGNAADMRSPNTRNSAFA